MEEIMNEDLNSGEGDKSQPAKKYSRTHQILSLTETVLFFAVILIFLLSGLSEKTEKFAYTISSGSYGAMLIYFAVLGIAESVISFPLGFYSDYILEHKYNLSNQTLRGYFLEKLKGLILVIVLGIPVLLAIFYILKTFGDNWWIAAGLFMFVFSVIIGRLAPTLIMPLFYKFIPLENESLKERIFALCKKTGVKIQGVFTFDMSKNTKKANAAFTGIGKSKRIIIGDTLINNFTEKEIEFVFAHEMGHYTKRHILKLMTVSTVLSFAGLFLTARLYESTIGFFGFESITRIAALPLLFLYLSIYGLVTAPLSNILSRKFEREADTFALDTTKDKESFVSAMEKLADQNLSDKTPNKIIEFLFHSHPSVEKRIQFAKNFRF